jgi:hypothetical protein
MNSRAVSWLAWSMLMLSLLLCALGCLLLLLNDHSLTQDAWYTLAFLAFPMVGVVISSRRPENPIGWMFCVIGVANGLYFFADEYAIYALVTRPGALPAGAWVARSQEWTSFIMWASMFFALLLFPSERLPSPRWRAVAWALAVVFVLFTPLFFIVVLAAPAFVLVRFWRARGEERQQLKWFAYAAGFWISVAGLRTLNDYVLRDPVIDNATNVLFGVGVVSVPVAVGVAILRYRLYDIDIIINRTLVYGALTATLVALYFGGIVLLQRVFVVLTGQKSTLAVVASTLLIAALFNPLRRRIQGFIDRRFYRRKYDARKTLEAFSAKLRDETNLEALNNELVRVVRDTMQPAHVSLWLRPDTPPKNEQAD